MQSILVRIGPMALGATLLASCGTSGSDAGGDGGADDASSSSGGYGSSSGSGGSSSSGGSSGSGSSSSSGSVADASSTCVAPPCVVQLHAGMGNPAFGIAVDSTNVYWTDEGPYNSTSGTVNAVPLGGGAVTVIARGLISPGPLAIDSTNAYFALTGPSGAVAKTPLAGGTPTTFVMQSGAMAIAVDHTNVYWGDFTGDGIIGKYPLAGGMASTVAPALVSAMAINSDSVYWTDGNAVGGAVLKVPLAGGVPVTLVTGQFAPSGIALDATSMYWTDDGNGSGQGAVMKASLSGSSPVTLVSGLAGPRAIAVDASSVYFADYIGAKLLKVPLDGGTVTTLATGGSPDAIAIDATSVYWADYDGSVWRRTPRRRRRRGPRGEARAACQPTSLGPGVGCRVGGGPKGRLRVINWRDTQHDVEGPAGVVRLAPPDVGPPRLRVVQEVEDLDLSLPDETTLVRPLDRNALHPAGLASARAADAFLKGGYPRGVRRCGSRFSDADAAVQAAAGEVIVNEPPAAKRLAAVRTSAPLGVAKCEQHQSTGSDRIPDSRVLGDERDGADRKERQPQPAPLPKTTEPGPCSSERVRLDSRLQRGVAAFHPCHAPSVRGPRAEIQAARLAQRGANA